MDFEPLARAASIPLDPRGEPAAPEPLEAWEPRHPKAALRGLFPPLTDLLTGRAGLFRSFFGLGKTRPRERLETKYPVILVHGANVPKILKVGPLKIQYFSRTEAYLRSLNVRLLVPSVDPMGSIEDRAKQLEEQILEVLPEGKFNLVCHSMGGLDARYLAVHRPIKDRIASITTVSTPHRGSWYADFADEWIFKKQGLYKLLGLLGMHIDQIPNLTVRHMEETFNPTTPDNPDIAYFSYGTYSSLFGAPPFYWGMNFIMRIAERRALARRQHRRPAWGPRTPVGIQGRQGKVMVGDETVRVMEGISDRGQHDWIVPKWVGKNDGVVSLSSSVWGNYLGTVKAHHWGPMGWLTRMKEYRFWEEVLRRLKAQGY